ncbi:triphosphoribosyl-dephospho-CoA synthase [Streptomyces sp. NPDC059373]
MPLAHAAVQAIVEEVALEGVPGRDPDRDPGAALWAAKSSLPGFEAMAAAARRVGEPTQELREELGAIGRSTEWTATRAGCGVRSHRGATWAVGLLVAAAALEPHGDAHAILATAKRLAGFRDRRAPLRPSRGSTVSTTYGAAGARGEARAGFPHVKRALAALRTSRDAGADEPVARLDALLAIMSSLQDTTLLHAAGPPVLRLVQGSARDAVDAGGAGSPGGRDVLAALDAELRERGLTPSGSSSLLAGVFFVDGLRVPVPR